VTAEALRAGRRKPRLLDLFCGAGGAGMGYHRAGFDVVGVDIEPQPNYPFEFIQADALDILGAEAFIRLFDGVHASPPCQSYSGMSECRPGVSEKYPALIEPVRNALIALGLPWVMENVVGAPLAGSDDLFGSYGVTLCGRMFGLELYRHRLFETSFPIGTPAHPPHTISASKAGHWEPGTVISVAGNCSPIAVARQSMGIGWMNRNELAESIPPAYCQFIGEQLAAHLAQSDLVGEAS
jgi:DNA (cytosine-5)-methyltransferase 1